MASRNFTVILNEDERNRLVEKYSYLVRQVASAVHPRFPANVEKDDLFSYGVLGLIDAIGKFDASKGVKFETYATSRIYGAMIDEIRRSDWVPRSIRAKQKKVELATRKLQSDHRIVDLDSLSQETGLSAARLQKLRKEVYRAGVQSLDETLNTSNEDGEGTLADLVPDDDTSNPSHELQLDQRRQLLAEAMQTLSDNERQILQAIYFEEVNLRTVSRRLNLSISRISQLHRRALSKMESFCEGHLDLMVG